MAGLVVLAAVFFCGCDGGGSGSPSEDLTGMWTLKFDSGATIEMTFDQESNGNVQGVGKDENGDAWSFSGKLRGEKLTGRTLPALDISALVDRNVIAGTYQKDATTSGSFTGERK